jgi:voltage-gated sodium channel
MEQFPHAWLFFVVFILVATFTMLNLFIAIIVNAMQSVHEEERSSASPDAELHAELQLLREEMRQLRDAMARGSNGT